MTSTETTVSAAKLDGIIRKIKGLLAVADDPATAPEAAASYRDRAEALMFTYRVEETLLAQQTPAAATALRPVWRTLWLAPVTSEFAQSYRSIAAYVLTHVGGKGVFTTARHEESGRTWFVAEGVGYEGDLRYADLLFQAASLEFGKRLEPKVDPTLSDEENAYRLRSAGMEGRRIALALWGRDDKPARSKARKMFAKVAAARGEDASVLMGQGNSVKVFRESYAEAFCSTLWERLYRLRTKAAQDERAVVLAGRSDAVEEALYERYPHMRPTPRKAVEGGEYTDPTKDCAKCAKAKSGYCREHAYLKPSTAAYKDEPFNAAGYQRGRDAARSVNLGSAGTDRVAGNSVRAIQN